MRVSFLQFDKFRLCKCGPTRCKSSSWRNSCNKSASLCLVDRREGIKASILCRLWKQLCCVAKSRSASPQKGNPEWKVRICLQCEQPVKGFEAIREHNQADLWTCCEVKLLKVAFTRKLQYQAADVR
jgi:hypothetical protein